MKSLSASLIVILTVLCLPSSGESVKRGTREHALALRDGAVTRFTFRIVDAEGSVVTGANTQASFATEWSTWIRGVSDSNGLFSVEGRSRGEMIYDVKKDGYYPTAGNYRFAGLGDIVLEDGKWQPWDPTNTVVLRHRKNPVPMYAVLA